MSEESATNRPMMKNHLNVMKSQIPSLVIKATIANIAPAADKVKADILNLAEKIKPVADKTFVMMKNKKVWFDRNNAALYPKFEDFTLPEFQTKGQPSKNYSVDFEGFHFVGMTRREGLNSFTGVSNNPYKQNDGNFRNFPNRHNWFQYVLTGEPTADGGMYFINNQNFNPNTSDNFFTLVPICRLKGKDSGKIEAAE